MSPWDFYRAHSHPLIMPLLEISWRGVRVDLEKRKEAIIAYREDHGPFKSIEELANVRGVGPSIVESNMDNLSLKDE